MYDKQTFAENLNRYMEKYNKSRVDLSKDLGISYNTITDWVKGKKIPRMDKVQLLANYFHTTMSELLEDKRPDFVLEDEEMKLILEFRKAPKADQDAIRRILMYAAALNKEGGDEDE